MQGMVKLNRTWIALLRSQHSKLGVVRFKISNIVDKTGGTPARREVRVTLRTVRIARGRKSNRPSMIGVAGSARGRECLRYVMQRTVMAGQALLVTYLFVEKTHCSRVADGTPLCENRVRR
jgi:hypothetical protein